MKKNVWTYIAISCCLIQARAQVSYRYPSAFYQYYNNLKLINPAEVAGSEQLELTGANQAFTGDFSNIGNYFGQVAVNLRGHDSSQIKHAMATSLIGEREGSLFSNSKLYLSYALRMKLSQKFSLALGVSAGMVSYVVRATANSGGASDQAFDANIGLCLSSQRLRVGMAVNQFANSSITPLVEQLVLKRYLELYTQHLLPLGMHAELKSMIHAALQPTRTLTPNITEMIALREIFNFGVSYTLQRQYGFIIGLDKIPVAQGKLKAYFSFHMPVNNMQVAQNMNTIAVLIGYTY